MPGTHALLSPSGAERWMSCTPSVQLEQRFPDNAGTAAEEGTLAHKLSEYYILRRLYDMGLRSRTSKETKAAIDLLEYIQGHALYAEDMRTHCIAFADYVLEIFAKAFKKDKHAKIYTERQLDFSEWAPEGWGTGDVVIVAGDTVYIIDLKYGTNKVQAKNNKQLRLYALGAYSTFSFLYDLVTVEATIYQPRIDNIATHVYTVVDLLKWANETLKPIAKMAFEGVGDFVPGLYCKYCRASGECRANAEQNLELAKYDFSDVDTLSAAEVGDILHRIPFFKEWIAAVQAQALYNAVNEDKEYPGFKVVEGRGRRVYAKPKRIIKTLLSDGFDEDVIAPRSLLAITNLQKLTGAKYVRDNLEKYILKNDGKPIMVADTDEREPFHRADGARLDFADIIDTRSEEDDYE